MMFLVLWRASVSRLVAIATTCSLAPVGPGGLLKQSDGAVIEAHAVVIFCIFDAHQQIGWLVFQSLLQSILCSVYVILLEQLNPQKRRAWA